MQEAQKYKSVTQLVNLPKKRHLSLPHEKIFDRSNLPAEDSKIEGSIITTRDQLINKVENQIQVFESEHYNYKFPASKFPEVPEGKPNSITYEQKVIKEDEDTFKPKLSQQQIDQMREKGEFEVKSNNPAITMPYIWKVNDNLLRGRKNIVNMWENGLAACYEILMNAWLFFLFVLPQGLRFVKSLPIQLFALVFGRRDLTPTFSSNYQKAVYQDFWTDILQNELRDLKNCLSFDLLHLLHVKYEPAAYQRLIIGENEDKSDFKNRSLIEQEKAKVYRKKQQKINEIKETMRQVQYRFQQNWVKIRKRALIKVSTPIEQANQKQINSLEQPQKTQARKKIDSLIVQKLEEEKFAIYIVHLKQHLTNQIGANIVEALVKLITIVRKVNLERDKLEERLAQIRTGIKEKIMKKHSIRSKVNRFLEKLTQAEYQPIKKQIEDQFYANLFSQTGLDKQLPLPYASIYKKYLALGRDFDRLVAQKKSTLKNVFVPTRIFRTTYMLLPPYEVIKTSNYYSLKREKEMTVDTSSNFWKFRLYGMRLKSWTINCVVALLGLSWVGPFGLRCLFGLNDFEYDENINYLDGVKSKSRRKTFLGVFATVRSGIAKSRHHFESLPDRGLFGKNFSRIFNYIQCYLFRLLIVGILGSLILYPICIVVLSLLCLLVVVTVWLWVPLSMSVCYVFNILLFQFETSNRYGGGLVVRGSPLIAVAITLVVLLVKLVLAIVRLVLIAPVLSSLYGLFLLAQRLFRTATDGVMVVVISKLGRTPSRDTAIARKISGPGMSRNFYYSINQEDVYILTQAALEKTLMYKLNEFTTRELNSTYQKYMDLMRCVLRPFGYGSPAIHQDRDLVVLNKNKVVNNYSRQFNNYMARYPSNPYNIRFSQEEIDTYFENCVKIVKNFVEKQHIKDWIFEQRETLHEDYEELTRKYWIEIFNCGEEIFEPLEKIDTRLTTSNFTESNTLKMKENVQSVMKALQGEVELKPTSTRVTPAKRSLLTHDRQFDYIISICNIHSQSTEGNVYIEVSNPNYLWVTPMNIEQSKKYDTYFWDQSIRDNPRTIIQ